MISLSDGSKSKGKGYLLPPIDEPVQGVQGVPSSVLNEFAPNGLFEKRELEVYGTKVIILNGIGVEGGLIYRIVEPKNGLIGQAMVDFLLSNSDLLLMDTEGKGNPEKYIEDRAISFLSKHYGGISSIDSPGVMYSLKKRFMGLGDLSVFLADVRIEDISASGTGQDVFVYLSGSEQSEEGYYSTGLKLDGKEYQDMILRVAQKSNISPSYLYPIQNGVMGESRVNIVYGDQVNPFHGSFTIRRVREIPLTIADLIAGRELNEEMAAWLWYVVESGFSGLVFGETGSGKTVFLNAILFFIPLGKKISIIEDTRELRIPQGNWTVGLSHTFSRSMPGYEEYTLYDQLKSSLRLRPDYIIVGEVRGTEASVMFDAMSTGHTGGGTVHAGSLEALRDRFSSESTYVPPALQNSLNFAVSLSQVDTVTGSHQRRRVMNIWENRPIEYRSAVNGRLNVAPEFVVDSNGNGVFSYDPSRDSFDSPSTTGKDSLLIRWQHSFMGKTVADAKVDLNARVVVMRYLVANRGHFRQSDVFATLTQYVNTGRIRPEWRQYAEDLPYEGGLP